MKRVILESPYKGDIKGNLFYARRCIRDAILRGEAPFASHLIYTQEGILNDHILEERQLGMKAGFEWIPVASAMVIYTDYGVSKGMREGIEIAIANKVRIEYRKLEI